MKGIQMSVQKCQFQTNVSQCSDEFGTQLAGRWFDMTEETIEAAAGRFTKGKNKGKTRGWIVWRKCTTGGWCFPLQCVIRPGMIFAHFVTTYDRAYEIVGYSTEKFFAGASRVDTCYGYDRKQVAAPVETTSEEIAPDVANVFEQAARSFRTMANDFLDNHSEGEDITDDLFEMFPSGMVAEILAAGLVRCDGPKVVKTDKICGLRVESILAAIQKNPEAFKGTVAA
jgi:hypothetical protein